jgi:hypothetical protein
MAITAIQNDPRKGSLPLQGRFGSRLQPFDRPLGFDQFCPALRQRTLKYFHIPAALFIAPNKIASNLDEVFNGSRP